MEHFKSLVLEVTDKIKTKASHGTSATAKDATQAAALCVTAYIIASVRISTVKYIATYVSTENLHGLLWSFA